MIAAALLFLAQVLEPTAVPTPTSPPGYGPWRLGMSKEQVSAVAQFGPYSAVGTTGGLETRGGVFAEQKTTISFVLGERGLRIIQIWAYEGRDLDQAVNAFYRVYHHLETSLGPVETPGLSIPEHADSDAFTGAVRSVLLAVPSNRAVKIQLAPRAKSPEINIFSSLMKQPQIGYYYVFLYYRAP
jgi:hypothetical protein